MRHVPTHMRNTSLIRNGRTWSAGALLAVVLLAGGCASQDSPSVATAGDAAAAPEFQSAEKPGAATDNLLGGTAKEQDKPADQAVVDDRSLIYRGDLTVRVKNVDEAAAQVSAAATTAGGFIGSEKRTSNVRDAQATLVLRVPSKGYQSVLDKLAGLGEELSRNSNVEDVTAAVLDLDVRIAAQRASVESVRKMYASAANLTELVMLEKELSQREAELASLEAKKRRLDDLVSLSTITVNLVGPETVVVEPEEDDPSFLDGLENGWNALVSTVVVLLAILGFLLPFLLVAAIPLTIWLLLRRRRRRRAAAVAAPSLPAAPAASPAEPSASPADSAAPASSAEPSASPHEPAAGRSAGPAPEPTEPPTRPTA
jgi:hypothetical protein